MNRKLMFREGRYSVTRINHDPVIGSEYLVSDEEHHFTLGACPALNIFSVKKLMIEYLRERQDSLEEYDAVTHTEDID